MRNCDLFSMLEKVKWQSQTKYFDKQNQKSTRGLLTGKVPGSRCGCQCLFFVMQNVWVNGRELVMEHIGWYLTDCEDVYMQVTERFCCLWSKCLMTRRGCRHRASYTTLTDVLMRVCVLISYVLRVVSYVREKEGLPFHSDSRGILLLVAYVWVR